GRGQGRHRAVGRRRGAGRCGDRRSGGRVRRRRRLPREVRRRFAGRDPAEPRRLPRAGGALLAVPRLVLTGFMATGKTEVGRLLARRLGRRFVDTDGLVETAAHCSVAQIFAGDGEAYFRRLERDAVEEACAVPDALIATGGGTLLDPDNRRRRDGEARVAAGASMTIEQADEVRVDRGARSYPVLIGAGLLAELGPRLAAAGFQGRCALVTSERVGALYREPAVASLGDAGLSPIV